MESIDFDAAYCESLARHIPDDEQTYNDPKNIGWNFQSGDPEIFKYSDRLIVPGGQALDIGTGNSLRNALYLAEMGMRVDGIDIDPSAIATAEVYKKHIESSYPIIIPRDEWRKDPQLPITLRVADVVADDLGVEVYDSVILSSVLFHANNKAEALKILENAIKAVKENGHLWVRTIGNMDSTYLRNLVAASNRHSGVGMIDNYTFFGYGHHGGHTQVFFEQHELTQIFSELDMRIVYSQVAPVPPIGLTEEEEKRFPHLTPDYRLYRMLLDETIDRSEEEMKAYLIEKAKRSAWGRQNMMYGENWNRGDALNMGSGLVSLLVQKTPRNPVVSISVCKL